VYTYITYIALNCRHTLYIEIAYTNYLISSSNTYTGKTPVPNSSTLSGHPSADRKPYYSNGLSLNKSIDPTNISL
jgi:hypothetical protein